MTNNTLELSEIQIKVLDELDLLSDAFISTFTKVGEKIEEFSTEINEIINKFLTGNWKVNNNESYDLLYKPFCYYQSKKYDIELLSSEFAVEGRFTAKRKKEDKDGEKKIDSFSLSWGFIYDKEQKPSKYFYIENETNRDWSNSMISKNEYEVIETRIKTVMGFNEYFFTLVHPDNEDKEWLQLSLDYEGINNLSKFFQVCKEEFIEKFISKIKD